MAPSSKPSRSTSSYRASTASSQRTSTTSQLSGSSSLRLSASSRMSAYKSRDEAARKAERDYAATIVPALAARSYHIPGNNWIQDWYQYFANNHPFFGMCCHHRLHPVKLRARIFILIGSIAFGLTITNLVVLWYLYYSEDDFDRKVFAVSVQANITLGAEKDLSVDEVAITNGQIFLWTFGSALHAMFDLTTWYIAASACCQPGGSLECLGSCKMLGSYLVIFLTVVMTAVATFLVVWRAAVDDDEERQDALKSESVLDSEIEFSNVEGAEDFRFLISFGIELVLALFLWYFVTGTILFTGILGCFKLPLLGGRPREMMLEEKSDAIRRSSTSETEEFP